MRIISCGYVPLFKTLDEPWQTVYQDICYVHITVKVFLTWLVHDGNFFKIIGDMCKLMMETKLCGNWNLKINPKWVLSPAIMLKTETHCFMKPIKGLTKAFICCPSSRGRNPRNKMLWGNSVSESYVWTSVLVRVVIDLQELLKYLNNWLGSSQFIPKVSWFFS